MSKSVASFFVRNLRIIAVSFLMVVAATFYFVAVRADTCAPVTNASITVNGVVVSPTGSSGSAFCMADPGWQGVVGHAFDAVVTPGGAAGSESANLFVVGSNVSNGKIGKLFIGVHTQNDPELTENDGVVLFIDANNNSTFDAGDFSLVYVLSPLTPPGNIEACSQPVGSFSAFKYVGGVNPWQSMTPNGITHQVALDYNGPTAMDPEDKIWELEIGIDIAAFNTTPDMNFQPSATGSSFRLGAKLNMFENGASGWLIWKMPSGLASDPDEDLFPNGDAGLTVPGGAASLDPITFDNCGDVIIESISSTAPSSGGTVPNGFRLLTAADFDGSNNTKPGRQTSFTASMRYQSGVAGTPMPSIPNPGTATFSIMPWGTSGMIGSVDMNTGSNSLPFNQINVSRTMSFDWPPNKAAYQPVQNLLNSASSSHACMSVRLNGYPINTPNGDFMQRNLSYVTTSTVKENFLITSACREKTQSAATNSYNKECADPVQEFILRVAWSNIAADQQCNHSPNRAELAKCELRTKWTYVFPTAKVLGLKHLGNGYYRITLKGNETRLIPITLIGGKMPVDPVAVTLSAQAGGKAINPQSGEMFRDVPVKAGQVLTIIATGQIFLQPGERKTPNGPDGVQIKFDQNLTTAAASAPRFLLNSSFYNPFDRVGALIGSFDGFRTSFVIGSNSTFMVPEGATTLSLAVNDVAGGFSDNTGAFVVNIIPSDPIIPPTRLALTAAPGLGVPVALQPGVALPQLQIDLYRRLPGRKPRTGLLRPAGNAIYAVYGSHVGRKNK